MARPLRIEYPGAFYHVINHGNAGCSVFKSIRDREKFFEKVVETVSREFECDAELIMRKGGKKNLPRDMAIYLARDLTGETTVMPGKKFGNILGAAISQRYIAFEEQMNKTKRINRQMVRIRKKILDK